MENQEKTVSSVRVLNSDGTEHQINGVNGSENLGDDLLEDLDSYLEDINDRLMISRMVSESVIKGMVTAVEYEAAEKVAAKELEVFSLRELLRVLQLGVDEIEFLGSLEHSEIGETLGDLRNLARKEIKKLKEEISNSLRGCSSIRRISSGSELSGLGGILQEKTSENYGGVDKTHCTLSTIVDDMFHLAKVSFCEWQEEKFRGELEATVIESCIRSSQEEFEEKMWAQNTVFSGSQSVNWVEKIKEISSLRQELDVVLKSLSVSETGQLHSHGSHDADHFHRVSNYVSSSSSLWEGNDESKTSTGESWDAAQLKHMKKDQLVDHFNTIIMNMKRDHESKVQVMTEDYFSLKREYLKDRGSSLPQRKDNKEFDVLKKKIPEVILKLDDILVENEKLPVFCNNAESIGILKVTLENLVSENRDLRESLVDKKKELECLSSQVSDAAEKMLKQSQKEANLRKLIGNLESSAEYAHLEAMVTEEVYKCALREVIADTQLDTEDLSVKSTVTQEARYFKCEIEDSDMELSIMEGLLVDIFGEVIKDAESQIGRLDAKYLHENEIRVALEIKTVEKEEGLKLLVEENERLKEEVQEKSAAFKKEQEQFELLSEELHELRDQASQQQKIIFESSKESDLTKGKLVEASEQIESGKVEMNKLNQKLELTMKQLDKADEERRMLQDVVQEKQNDLLLVQAKEKEQSEQMGRVLVLVHALLKALADTESKISERIDKHNLRLDYVTSQLSSYTLKAAKLRKSGLLYKQRLERKCSDLQMAEAEVDLLGDEVDTLLSILEKVYVALDHYSPVLQHYSGITEILKLVRRELSGESIKSEQSCT